MKFIISTHKYIILEILINRASHAKDSRGSGETANIIVNASLLNRKKTFSHMLINLSCRRYRAIVSRGF